MTTNSPTFSLVDRTGEHLSQAVHHPWVVLDRISCPRKGFTSMTPGYWVLVLSRGDVAIRFILGKVIDDVQAREANGVDFTAT